MEKEKILLIEDNSEIRVSITEILEYAGYQAFTADNGLSGLKIAKEILPDLILCDIMMPGMEGTEVLRHLSSDVQTNCIPFIFLTAKADLPDIRKGMQLGADDYITKPFKALDLILSVKTRLNRINSIKHLSTSIHDITDAPDARFSYDQQVFLSDLNEKRFVRISDIVAITADCDYTNVFLRDGSKIYLRRLLGDWNKILPFHKFFRIHRSTIINIEYVEKIDKWFNRSLKLYVKYINRSFIASERYSVQLKKEMGI